MMPKKISDDEFLEFTNRLANWTIPGDAIDCVHDMARASLNEVKALTEYEDGKASRLLTIIAFLSAVVGAVFTRFAGDYVMPPFSNLAWTLPLVLPTITYASFFVYVMLVTYSVSSVVGAIRPRFIIPKTWKDPKAQGDPSSMVFYKGILDTNIMQWQRVFEENARDEGMPLKTLYAKNYIAEAYLVANKVAQKLDALRRGIGTLRIALVFLLVFFAAYAATVISVDPTRVSWSAAATNLGK